MRRIDPAQCRPGSAMPGLQIKPHLAVDGLSPPGFMRPAIGNPAGKIITQ